MLIIEQPVCSQQPIMDSTKVLLRGGFLRVRGLGEVEEEVKNGSQLQP
jgi:hypothetical protein